MMIPKEAKVCPHCRKKQGMSTGKGILIALALFIGFIILTNVNKEETKITPTTPIQEVTAPGKVEYVLELQSWNWGVEHKYAVAEGLVKNTSSKSLENVVALVNIFDKNGEFIKSDKALIEYNPILPGQTSPFKVMASHNPAMEKASIDFGTLFGKKLHWKNKDKKI